jgi:hypothetical protein
MVYGTKIRILTGISKPTYNWGGPHCKNRLHEGIIDYNGFLIDHRFSRFMKDSITIGL